MRHDHICGNCGTSYFQETQRTETTRIPELNTGIHMAYTVCPKCKAINVKLMKGYDLTGLTMLGEYPSEGTAKIATAPPEVPQHIAQDFEEAVSVLPISPKASSALARRCLQNVLREQGYNQKDLVQQVQAILDEQDPKKGIPQTLHDAVDAIRNFGNFAAHPMSDVTTLQVIDVEPGEADWCLEILIECFEVFYVRPERIAEKKKLLNAKLQAAGKPPAK